MIRWYPDGVNTYPVGGSATNWGPPVALAFPSGPAHALSIATTARQQAEWLGRIQPHYLLTFPSLLPDLARECASQNVVLERLRHVRTVAEYVDPDVRTLCRKAWGVPVHDMYSAQEVGYIGLQCPAEEQYHLQSESVFVDVLRENGDPCAPGEVGRVVVTPLHNFAMPLIRYALGDYAEAGSPCSCGRGLPVLRRIFGRARNMLCLPNGERIWPRLGELRYVEILPIEQYQVVQKEVGRLEVRLVSARRGTEEEERRLKAIIVGRLGYLLDVDVVYVDNIPRGPGGKFEEFKSELGST